MLGRAGSDAGPCRLGRVTKISERRHGAVWGTVPIPSRPRTESLNHAVPNERGLSPDAAGGGKKTRGCLVYVGMKLQFLFAIVALLAITLALAGWAWQGARRLAFA